MSRIGIVGVAAIAPVFMLGACRSQKPPEPKSTAPEPKDAHQEHQEHGQDVVRIEEEMIRDLRITTTAVEARAGGEGVAAVGELRVNEDAYAEIGSPAPARVVRMLAGPGDNVRRGQPLVELQSTDLGRARSDLRAAQARLDLARKALERKRDLAEERIAPRREVQEAEAALAEAEASLGAAHSALLATGLSEIDVGRLEGADGSRFPLRSPISGTIIERTAVRGQVSAPGKPLFRVGDLSMLWLTVQAFERDALRVRPDAPARVTFAALPGQTFSGRVRLVGKQVDPASRTIPVRVDVANQRGLLRPGMSATVWLALGDPAATVTSVPAASLQRLQNQWCVFIPKDEGVFEKRVVGRGRDLGGEVEILSGLKPGETIVVDGAFLLKAEAEKSLGEGEHHDH